MIELIRWSARGAPGPLAVALLAGLASGALSAAVIALFGQGLAAAGRSASSGGLVGQSFLTPGLFAAAAGLIVLAAASELLTRWLHYRINGLQTEQMREEMILRALGTDLTQAEQIGMRTIQAALVEDVQIVGQALTTLPIMAVSAAVVIGCCAYLAWLSPQTLLMLGALLLPMVWLVTVINALGRRWFGDFLRDRDRQLRGLTSVVDGFRELKLSLGRQDMLLARRLGPANDAARRSHLRALMGFALGYFATQVTYALGILLVFLLASLGLLGHEVIASFALTTVFMKEHVGRILNAYPIWSQAAVVRRRHAEQLDLPPIEAVRDRTPPTVRPHGATALLEVRDVRYVRPADDPQDGFGLGPIDAVFRPGEVTFIIGENGSGKSTFARLLCGLALPDTGAIRLNGRPLAAASAQAHREHFSVVFTDSYVFDDLPIPVDATQAALAADHLRRLELSTKVTIKNGALSTTRLSHGQRKRLALLAALLEDRPGIILDEWAATQDPRFKRFFYRELLGQLKAGGKTVVVITHDMEFADCADRILTMDNGRLHETSAPLIGA